MEEGIRIMHALMDRIKALKFALPDKNGWQEVLDIEDSELFEQVKKYEMAYNESK
jgi:hypothetical protein